MRNRIKNATRTTRGRANQSYSVALRVLNECYRTLPDVKTTWNEYGSQFISIGCMMTAVTFVAACCYIAILAANAEQTANASQQQLIGNAIDQIAAEHSCGYGLEFFHRKYNKPTIIENLYLNCENFPTTLEVTNLIANTQTLISENYRDMLNDRDVSDWLKTMFGLMYIMPVASVGLMLFFVIANTNIRRLSQKLNYDDNQNQAVVIQLAQEAKSQGENAIVQSAKTFRFSGLGEREVVIQKARKTLGYSTKYNLDPEFAIHLDKFGLQWFMMPFLVPDLNFRSLYPHVTKALFNLDYDATLKIMKAVTHYLYEATIALLQTKQGIYSTGLFNERTKALETQQSNRIDWIKNEEQRATSLRKNQN